MTNLKNGKWIIVRVNDRGPYVGNRIMDLSYSAARMLNFRDGVERVRIDLIQPENVALNRVIAHNKRKIIYWKAWPLILSETRSLARILRDAGAPYCCLGRFQRQ